MFRELTRIKQKIPESECIELLIKETRGVLSMAGEDGYPYAIPLNHCYDPASGKVYFHCGKIGYKTDLLRQNDKVCYVVTENGVRQEGEWWLTVRSIVVFGRIEMTEDLAEIERISELLSSKFTTDAAYIRDEIEKYAASTLLLKMSIDHISGKRVKEK
ncbi:MAG: pyridoxamine 5'-phosphate oxidase family protein [Clostridia bacterium]|nr:pyridoxamine 5'-phosphate oxidase family protein [Clostridia bacterium]